MFLLFASLLRATFFGVEHSIFRPPKMIVDAFFCRCYRRTLTDAVAYFVPTLYDHLNVVAVVVVAVAAVVVVVKAMSLRPLE